MASLLDIAGVTTAYDKADVLQSVSPGRRSPPAGGSRRSSQPCSGCRVLAEKRWRSARMGSTARWGRTQGRARKFVGHHELEPDETHSDCGSDGGSSGGSKLARLAGARSGRTAGANGEGLLSAVARNLRVQKGCAKRAGARARDLLLQVLVLSQRVRQGHSAAHRPLPETQFAVRAAGERRHGEGQAARRRAGNARLQTCFERRGSRRSGELPAGEVLLGLR